MKLLKFYTPACVHCPGVKQYLDENKIEYEGVNLFDYPDKSVKYKVLGVPTLMILDDEDKEVVRHVGGKIENIEQFLKDNGLIKGE